MKRNEKFEKYCSRERICDDLKPLCCKKGCKDSFSLQQILVARQIYHDQNEQAKLKWIINTLNNFYNEEDNILVLTIKGNFLLSIYSLIFFR
jgi:hypothetical protein